jgi:hypothetical protein
MSKGKVPVSKKNDVELSHSFDDLDYNILKLDPELEKEIKAKGLVVRWVNAKKYQVDGNYHRSGWRAYKLDSASTAGKGSLDFNFGVTPEGYVIRNDLLLAYKTKESQERWRARIQAKTAAQNGRSYAKELKAAFSDKGVAAKIHDGYEEGDDE